MFHDKRRWVIFNVSGEKELADKLTNFTWCGCNGFRLRGYLFLNDSFSPGGAQEFGIIRERDMKQIESITFGWCSYEEALKYIRATLAGYFDESAWIPSYPVMIEEPSAHWRCALCA